MDADLLNGNGNTSSINTNDQTKASKKIEKSKKSNDSIDCQQAFDDIVLGEHNFVERGFSDGHISGLAKQSKEGYALGIEKGFEIGSEVGQYRGFALVLLQRLQLNSDDSPVNKKHQRCVKILEKLLKSTEEILSSNPRVQSGTDVDNPVDVWESLRDMRGKFVSAKKLLSLDEPLDTKAAENSISGSKAIHKPKTLNW